MRTRRGVAYSVSPPSSPFHSSSSSSSSSDRPSKRARISLRQQKLQQKDSDSSSSHHHGSFLHHINPFDSLPDDLLLSIFVCIGASASSPSDLLAAKRTCKKFRALATHPMVLQKASLAALQISADRWDDDAKTYLQSCAEAGNAEACYTLGMIRFYCLAEREEGIMVMTKAAKAGHPSALHSLAVIQFNGSGGARKHKNLKAGVSLCARAAAAGHIDAMRELGHCLQDGYGIAKNVLEGRRLLLEANAREVAAAVRGGAAASLRPFSASAASSSSSSTPPIDDQSQSTTTPSSKPLPAGCFRRHLLCAAAAAAASDTKNHHHLPIYYKVLQSSSGAAACSSLLSDFGCNVPLPDLHPCHAFLVRWFTALRPPSAGLRLCSHRHCGRPETRRHEFRRCSACGNVNYCSRACQALDWKLRHKFVCVPAANWQQHNGAAAAAANGVAGGDAVAPPGNGGAAAAPPNQVHYLPNNNNHNHNNVQDRHHIHYLPHLPAAHNPMMQYPAVMGLGAQIFQRRRHAHQPVAHIHNINHHFHYHLALDELPADQLHIHHHHSAAERPPQNHHIQQIHPHPAQMMILQHRHRHIHPHPVDERPPPPPDQNPHHHHHHHHLSDHHIHYQPDELVAARN